MTEQSPESDYAVLRETIDYEVSTKDGEIIAACRCGAGEIWSDNAFGRLNMASWMTRHEHPTPPGASS